MFQAVAGDQIIHFRYGFYTTGAVGLWRTTDIAAIHLTFGACLAMVFAISGSAGIQRFALFLLSGVFAMISLLTGRRKAIVQVVVFFGLYCYLLARYGPGRSINQLLGLAVTAVGIAAMIFLLEPSEFFGDDFVEYLDRAASAPGDIWGRFNALGLQAFRRGLEVSGGFGLGVGTLAQTGAANVSSIRGAGFAYLTESGLGKIVAELGFPGLFLILPLIWGIWRAMLHCLRLLSHMSAASSMFEIGLLAFALSNIPFFSAAAGVYGDPFVLILIGISFGSLFAIPCILFEKSMTLQGQSLQLQSLSN